MVRLQRGAERDFARLPARVRERFYVAFSNLATDPYRPRPGCDIRNLEGTGRIKGIRVGSHRGVYEAVGREVWFTQFGHRRSIYR